MASLTSGSPTPTATERPTCSSSTPTATARSTSRWWTWTRMAHRTPWSTATAVCHRRRSPARLPALEHGQVVRLVGVVHGGQPPLGAGQQRLELVDRADQI